MHVRDLPADERALLVRIAYHRRGLSDATQQLVVKRRLRQYSEQRAQVAVILREREWLERRAGWRTTARGLQDGRRVSEAE